MEFCDVFVKLWLQLQTWSIQLYHIVVWQPLHRLQEREAYILTYYTVSVSDFLIKGAYWLSNFLCLNSMLKFSIIIA